MVKRVSAKGAAQTSRRDEKAALNAAKTSDSFQNFLHNMGVGTDNPTSSSTYGFNPISRVHTLLEWIHRGSWLGGLAVDIVADDMTRGGIDFLSTMAPDDAEQLQGAIVRLGVMEGVCDEVKWSRLYGGCIAVALIDGQDTATPLNIQSVRPGQFKGLLVLDRWMVEPSLGNLITAFGPSLGLPKFYKVATGAPALNGAVIHHSRCIRMEGIRLPYWQRVQENMWGLSVLERLYDRMIAFDSATQGASQLVYKSYLRYIKIKDFREAVAGGPEATGGIIKYLEMMRRFQGIEGLTVIDAEDDFGAQTHSAFSGLSEALQQFGQQLSGALQIPLVRLFGQSPGGMNSSGESDLRTYYDGIMQQQERSLRVPFDWLFRVIARSERINLPENFNFKFKSLWEMTPEQKGNIASVRSAAVLQAQAAGVIDVATALKELRQIGRDTGTFTNITDEMIEQAEAVPPPGLGGLGLAMGPNMMGSGLPQVGEGQPLPGETQPILGQAA
jgi:phage-related protein (TIGR01555 family)